MVGVNDFDRIRERFSALWENEILDRCCISAFAIDPAVKARCLALPDEAMDRRYFLTDGEMIRKRHMDLFEHTYFAGDAFPLVNLNMGPAGHAACIRGVRVEYSDETFWYEPIMEERLDPAKVVLDRQSYLYRQTFRAGKYLCEEADGRYLVSMPDNSGNMDVLSSLRTPTELLQDMITDEEEVKECLRRIEAIWEKSTSDIYHCLKDYNFGGSCIGWLNTWAPGFHNQMQCDISVMFSNGYYEKYAREELERQSTFLDYALYHLDGQEQIRHLDTLLSIDGLKMIQWTHVVAQPSPVEFIPVLKRIQDAGKGLLLLLDPWEVEPILENLSSRGLFINVKTKTKAEADDMVRLAERLTHE